MKTISRSLQLIGASSFVLLAGPVLASGYNFGTQSASNQGVANAGAAGLTDASVLFYNPAGMTRVEGTQISGVLNYIMPDGNFSNSGTVNAIGQPISGNNGGSFGVDTLVPHLYMTSQLNDKWTIGAGLFVPFGSHTDYDKGWVGRYNSTESELKTINFNPSVAYKINDMFSIGGGVSVQYIQGKLSKNLDLGLSAVNGANAAVKKICAAAPTSPQCKGGAAAVKNAAGTMVSNPTYDGSSEVTGDDVAFGFNLGATVNFSPTTRMGVAYRSAISHTLEGDAKFTVPQNFASSALGALLGGGAQATLNSQLKNTSANLSVDTPESFSINGFHQINEQWAIMADYTWTRHSRLDEIRVKLANGLPDSVTVTNWTNTNRYSVGATYQASDKWLIRTGMAYDQAPENDSNRITSIPDSDRIWFALGANYAITPNQSIDLTAIYVDLANSKVSQKDQNGSIAKGNYDVSSITLGAQYNYRF
ncbi:transporter [Chitinibacter bivalviorum]|uniref:Transporter n=1 Tax=Chitinibacter bivalviorum TaxID=2739434 RepID=A0A7H9BGM5_9NEIS|nr:outer membrane protein transport protein [Chitinibacter bivalviorum]QLG87870.1 transporter [Chitinibacter bivalviorum]